MAPSPSKNMRSIFKSRFSGRVPLVQHEPTRENSATDVRPPSDAGSVPVTMDIVWLSVTNDGRKYKRFCSPESLRLLS